MYDHCVRYVMCSMYNCLLLNLLHVALCTDNDIMTDAMIITSTKRSCTSLMYWYYLLYVLLLLSLLSMEESCTCLHTESTVCPCCAHRLL
jgi:hypothetical protein